MLRVRQYSGSCRFSVTLFSIVLAGASSTAVAQDLSESGDWNSAPGTWLYHTVTAVHLPTAKNQILIWERTGNTAQLWNPADGSFTGMGTSQLLFCTGHAGLPGGRVLVAGGGDHGGGDLTDANIFNILGPGDPWEPVTDMQLPRFYPTCTTLPDGRVLTTGGFRGIGVDFPEIFNPSDETWQSLPSAARGVGLYPFMFVLGGGNVFLAGANEPVSDVTSVLNLDCPGPAFWDDVGTNPLHGNYSSAVMYAQDIVLISGGEPGGVVTDETARFDFNQPIPQWEILPSPMVERRRHHDLVLLPTGHVLAVGGENDNGPVFDAEWFDPAAPIPVWRRLAGMTHPRGEHSTAVLLVDATVLVAGDEDSAASGEIFSPPYLFSGNSLASRPVIGFVSPRATYGADFRVIFAMDSPVSPDGVRMVTLVRLAAVTHGFDQNQRFVELDFDVLDFETLNVTAPANSTRAPPGYYMLFLISTSGVPSRAEYIQLG